MATCAVQRNTTFAHLLSHTCKGKSESLALLRCRTQASNGTHSMHQKRQVLNVSVGGLGQRRSSGKCVRKMKKHSVANRAATHPALLGRFRAIHRDIPQSPHDLKILTLSATTGSLWWIMWRASTHDAQRAAGAILSARLKPRPPMRMGSDGDVVATPWSCRSPESANNVSPAPSPSRVRGRKVLL